MILLDKTRKSNKKNYERAATCIHLKKIYRRKLCRYDLLHVREIHFQTRKQHLAESESDHRDFQAQTETYQSRTRRSVEHGTDSYATVAIDVVQAEKRILSEFGPKACVLEEPCRIHAWKAVPGEQPDWNDILR
uniref:Uncharacterized protein n=1 Tax=Phlebotomus papatasi TaxID=29031 RepID=A0A1B0D6Q4_PHLPP